MAEHRAPKARGFLVKETLCKAEKEKGDKSVVREWIGFAVVQGDEDGGGDGGPYGLVDAQGKSAAESDRALEEDESESGFLPERCTCEDERNQRDKTPTPGVLDERQGILVVEGETQGGGGNASQPANSRGAGEDRCRIANSCL